MNEQLPPVTFEFGVASHFAEVPGDRALAYQTELLVRIDRMGVSSLLEQTYLPLAHHSTLKKHLKESSPHNDRLILAPYRALMVTNERQHYARILNNGREADIETTLFLTERPHCVLTAGASYTPCAAGLEALRKRVTTRRKLAERL